MILTTNKTITTKIMKVLLKELGFEHLPMVSKFVEYLALISVESIATKSNQLNQIHRLIRLTSKPLALWQFVACDEEGKVLVEPKGYDKDFDYIQIGQDHPCKQYQKSLDRVMFEGWELIKGVSEGEIVVKQHNQKIKLNGKKCGTIEQFINDGGKLTLKK